MPLKVAPMCSKVHGFSHPAKFYLWRNRRFRDYWRFWQNFREFKPAWWLPDLPEIQLPHQADCLEKPGSCSVVVSKALEDDSSKRSKHIGDAGKQVQFLLQIVLERHLLCNFENSRYATPKQMWWKIELRFIRHLFNINSNGKIWFMFYKILEFYFLETFKINTNIDIAISVILMKIRYDLKVAS